MAQFTLRFNSSFSHKDFEALFELKTSRCARLKRKYVHMMYSL